MKTLIAAVFAIALSASSAFAQTCATDTPLSLIGDDGAGNGIFSNDGGNTFDGSLFDQIIGPNNDGRGVAHLQGSADCSALAHALEKQIEDAQNESAALAAALSVPSFLAENENFSIAGGIGFSDDSVAGGATAMFRVNRTVSAYAGGAVGEEQWAGKAGLRFAW